MERQQRYDEGRKPRLWFYDIRPGDWVKDISLRIVGGTPKEDKQEDYSRYFTRKRIESKTAS